MLYSVVIFGHLYYISYLCNVKTFSPRQHGKVKLMTTAILVSDITSEEKHCIHVLVEQTLIGSRISPYTKKLHKLLSDLRHSIEKAETDDGVFEKVEAQVSDIRDYLGKVLANEDDLDSEFKYVVELRNFLNRNS